MKPALFSLTSLDNPASPDNSWFLDTPTLFNDTGGSLQFAVPATGTHDLAAFGAQGGGAMKQALLASTALGSQATLGSPTPFNYTGAIVQFVVPATGTYDIAAFGAEGGSGAGNAGGDGGEAAGVFTLTAGEILEIAVGGAGANGSSPKGAGGGGGGSFVILDDNGTNSVLVVGGGGGGGSGVNAYGGAGQAGGTATRGNGSGGGGNHTQYGGGGGAGYKGNGSTAGGFGSPSATDGIGGKDYANGLFGGAGAAGTFSQGAGGAGGFGGGGGGGGGGGFSPTFFGYGGGGGGYTGGYAGGGAAPHVARGGSSFLAAGASQTTFTAGVQTGSGYVSVTELACFATGTRIETDRGLVPVERLRVGMRATTSDGQTREIVWIGHRTVDCLAHPEPAKVKPVRVSAGAFGAGVPARDVRLSPDHAVFVAGVLIPVRCLINDATIRQEATTAITYFHVELAGHDVIFAEGLPVESFLDTGNRAAFANGGTIARLAPDFGANSNAWQWETAACAPLIVTGRKLQAVRARLREIADQRLASPHAAQFAA
jgi:hypothetical protein